MKVKLLGFVAGLVAVATLGVAQLQVQAAEPGKVPGAPRCTVVADGARSSAFSIKNGIATVGFKVTGSNDCKVKLSTAAFYAQAMDGRPYNKQILYQRNTKIFTPGHYTMTVAVPQKSNEAQGCFYQLDLTYGVHNVTPVLAYGHGAVDCSVPPAPNPIATCDALTVNPVSRTSFTFTAKASTKNGAKINGYTYTVSKDGNVVATKTIQTSATTSSYSYSQAAPGTYTVAVTVASSAGQIKNANCQATFTVQALPNKVQVCDASTGTIIWVDEKDKGNYQPVTSDECSKVTVCDEKSGTMITVKKSEAANYTSTCPEKEVVPAALPETGPMDGAMQVVGAASLAGASGYYLVSRRRDS